MRRPVLLCLLAITALVANVAAASAAPGDPFQWKSFFDTSAIPGGVEAPNTIAVNHETGNVLMLEHGRIDQFDAEGKPVNFPATGSPILEPGGGQVLLVDNSGTATQGNIYVIDTNGCCGNGGERFWTYDEEGFPIGTNPHPASEQFAPVGGVVFPNGQFWMFGIEYSQYVIEAQQFAPDGSKIGGHFPFPAKGGYNPAVVDGNGFLYLPGEGGTYRKYEYVPTPTPEFKDLGETGLPVPGSEEGPAIVDPTDGALLTRLREKVVQIPATNPLVKSTPTTTVSGLAGYGAIALDATGQTMYVAEYKRIGIFHREPASAPYALQPIEVDSVRSNKVEVHSGLVAGGSPTTYHYEYGTTTAYGLRSPDFAATYSHYAVQFENELANLAPATTYHVRLVAENGVDTAYGVDRTFRTFAVPGGTAEAACPNSLARKQTGALRLPNCRAYELVSAADTGGYDVESYLAPGQTPFPGFPFAPSRVLYSTHSGAIPGPWNATNNGIDPYIASRTDNGWVTNYAGLPANINLATPSFASSLGEADPGLNSLAFAGPNLCRPCFTGGGLETGIPVRLANGSLVQGMAGSLAPGVATARPEGTVRRWFSGDGRYLLFASRYAFEPGANTGGDLTVYERDLAAGTTRIVSRDAAGATLTGAGISELAVSTDGSRVLVGKRVSVDSAGNEYVHPYLFIAGLGRSIDLDPGATAGVLFAGMSEDGSKIFFTTIDKLLPADEDPSADLYEVAADPSGQPTISLLSGGGAASCNPAPNTGRTHWNSVGAVANCDPVAVGGGGGVSASGNAIYFLSPEQLDGSLGTANQPNLFVSRGGGPAQFVATLEPDNPLVIDSLDNAETRETGDFQTSPGGTYAAFLSAIPLTGVHTFDHLQVFRSGPAAGNLVCASCDYSETNDESLAYDAELAPDGLGILEDGRVFFTTLQALVLNDANRRTDVYQYGEGGQELISSGSGPFNSGLLTVSAGGTDVFFFTHEPLAPEEDRNGSLMRIYDAREEGGFFKLPPTIPCKASDECHGPGTVAPGPPMIQSSGKTTSGNFVICKKNQVKRHGKCVKKNTKQKAKKKENKKPAKQGKQNAKGGKTRSQGGKKNA
jgi:hypothetical protein